MVICDFRNRYEFLRFNFEQEFTYNGKVYSTAERAFYASAMKLEDLKELARVGDKETLDYIKSLQSVYLLIDGWLAQRDYILYEVLKAKYSVPVLKEKLLEIDSKDIIVFLSSDLYLGKRKHQGSNMLGITTMRILNEFRNLD